MTMPAMITNNWKAWVNGTVSAIITGAVAAVGMASVEPENFGLTTGDYLKIGKVILGGAVLGLINHLRTSPFPNLFSDEPTIPPAPKEEGK
jgi:hypothetical protein